MTAVRSIPAGYHAVTPALTTRDVEKAIGFYKRAFGAEERMRFLGPDEKSIMACGNQNRGFDHDAG